MDPSSVDNCLPFCDSDSKSNDQFGWLGLNSSSQFEMPFSQGYFGSVNMFDSDNEMFSQMNDSWFLNNLLAFDDPDFHMDLGLVDS